MLEPNVCPVCWAFQNPDTGHCLVCGKRYNILNIPLVTIPCQETIVGSFVIPYPNGNIIFDASVTMECYAEDTFIIDTPRMAPTNKAQIVFDLKPDKDTNALFTIYSH